MPTPAACAHCGHVSYLPDGWASPGFTCPACSRPSAAPLALPPPMLIVTPPADPLAFDDSPARTRHDRSPGSGAFAAGFGGAFGGALGGVLGVVVGIVLVVGLLCAGCAVTEQLRQENRKEQLR